MADSHDVASASIHPTSIGYLTDFAARVSVILPMGSFLQRAPSGVMNERRRITGHGLPPTSRNRKPHGRQIHGAYLNFEIPSARPKVPRQRVADRSGDSAVANPSHVDVPLSEPERPLLGRRGPSHPPKRLHWPRRRRPALSGCMRSSTTASASSPARTASGSSSTADPEMT